MLEGSFFFFFFFLFALYFSWTIKLKAQFFNLKVHLPSHTVARFEICYRLKRICPKGIPSPLPQSDQLPCDFFLLFFYAILNKQEEIIDRSNERERKDCIDHSLSPSWCWWFPWTFLFPPRRIFSFSVYSWWGNQHSPSFLVTFPPFCFLSLSFISFENFFFPPLLDWKSSS